MRLIQRLEDFGITEDLVNWDDLPRAIEWAEQQDDLEHEVVLTVYRYASSPIGGDEIEDTGYIAVLGSREVCFYWCENAGGLAYAACFDLAPLQHLGTWLSQLMAVLGYTFSQFVDCELINRAPKILTRSKVRSIIEDAVARGFAVAETDEEGRTLQQWFAAQYQE